MISIIIPAYNVEKYIHKCLDHLIHQTYQELEIIVIDDGSTDATPAILDQYASIDSRIHVIHQANGGVSAARNAGLEQVHGEFLFYVDADDWISETYLEELMYYFDEDIDIVGGNCEEVVEDGCEPFHLFQNPNWGKLTQKDCIHDVYFNEFYTKVIWGKIYRSELWKDIRFTKIKYSEDTRAMFEILLKIQNYYLVDLKGYYYLQRATSASHMLREDIQAGLTTTLHFIYEVAKNQYPEYLEQASNNLINYAYGLLKIYVKDHRVQEAYELIELMQEAKGNMITYALTRAQKLLGLNKHLVYRLIWLKNLLNRGS